MVTTGAYVDYNNDENIANLYGRLYNNYAITDGRNICPKGWHVASYGDFYTLIGFTSDLKEAGLTHWIGPNTATNASGFTALPAGYREANSYLFIGERTYWWTTSRGNIGTRAYGVDYLNHITLAEFDNAWVLVLVA